MCDFLLLTNSNRCPISHRFPLKKAHFSYPSPFNPKFENVFLELHLYNFARREPQQMAYYHRLNGSSSPVLTATSLSYEKAKNSTPHRIKTPDLIKIKFGMVDYVG